MLNEAKRWAELDHCAAASGWQLAQGVWQESGISWEQPADDRQVPDWAGHPRNASSGQSSQEDGRQMALPPSAHSAAAVRHPLASMPLGAPTFADGPAPAAPRLRRPLPRTAHPDDLFQAWHKSVREASAREQTTGRSYGRWVVRTGVPLAVIVTVGVGAVMMLTGKTNSVLTHHAEPGSPAPGGRGRAAWRCLCLPCPTLCSRPATF